MFAENLKIVEERIQAACDRVGRDRSEVTLIAVSKTKPNEVLEEAYNEGIRFFGENKVQELAGKIDSLPDDIHWHMIGHLQRNKVKYIAGKVDLIHSVDTYRLAEAINIEAKKRGIIIPILIEVNVAGEETKFGVRPDEVDQFIKDILHLDGIKVKGLMTIAPYVVDSEDNRKIFRKIKDLTLDISAKNYNNVNMDIISMGMTNDYEVAIEEGATMVRVGTALFGERNYKNVNTN